MILGIMVEPPAKTISSISWDYGLWIIREKKVKSQKIYAIQTNANDFE